MLLRAQANTGLGQTTSGNTLGREAFHMLEEVRAEARRWKEQSEQKDSLICKLVSVVTGHQAMTVGFFHILTCSFTIIFLFISKQS